MATSDGMLVVLAAYGKHVSLCGSVCVAQCGGSLLHDVMAKPCYFCSWVHRHLMTVQMERTSGDVEEKINVAALHTKYTAFVSYRLRAVQCVLERWRQHAET